MVFQNSQKVPTRARLGPKQREIVLRHVLRFPVLYNRAYEDLREEYFDKTTDSSLWIVWHVAKRVISNLFSGKLPEPSLLWDSISAEIEAMVLAGELVLSVEDEATLFAEEGLLYSFFGIDESLDIAFGEKLFSDFLTEKLVYDSIISMAGQCAGTVPADISKELEKVQSYDRFIKSIRANSAKTAVPETLGKHGLGKESTGLTFFDKLFAGGDAPKEVYGVMGPYGSGKTTLAVQLCVEKAKVFQQKAAEEGAKPKTTHLFFYEASYAEIVRRLWSYTAKISRETMENFTGENWEIFSTTGNLKDYEQRLFAVDINAHGIENVYGEYERFLIGKEALTNVVLHNFSGMDEDNSGLTYGNGYVEEIAASLRNYCNNTGNEIGAVYVDYVLIAARNHMNFKNYREERLRHLVGGFPGAVLRQVAGPFDCCVYLMHQLAAASNGRNFNANFTNADSAESKSFPENLWFNVYLGVRDPASGVMKIGLAKTRRGPGVQPCLIRMDGTIGRFSSADDYVVDPQTGKPVPKQDFSLLSEEIDVDAPVQLPADDGVDPYAYE